MDENKNTVNNDTQNTSDMNYSFDFANQVQNDTPQDVATTPEQTTNVSETPVTAEVPIDTTSSESSAVAPENAASEATAAPTSETTTQTASAETNATTGDTVAPAPEVATPETTSTDNSEEDSIELIKDKKETKRFLIILFVVILVFIIALPFITKFLG